MTVTVIARQLKRADDERKPKQCDTGDDSQAAIPQPPSNISSLAVLHVEDLMGPGVYSYSILYVIIPRKVFRLKYHVSYIFKEFFLISKFREFPFREPIVAYAFHPPGNSSGPCFINLRDAAVAAAAAAAGDDAAAVAADQLCFWLILNSLRVSKQCQCFCSGTHLSGSSVTPVH